MKKQLLIPLESGRREAGGFEGKSACLSKQKIEGVIEEEIEEFDRRSDRVVGW